MQNEIKQRESLAQRKIELIKKIVNAKLTEEEIQTITNKAQEIINRRPGGKVLHEIPVYNQTDTDGILKEALSNQ